LGDWPISWIRVELINRTIDYPTHSFDRVDGFDRRLLLNDDTLNDVIFSRVDSSLTLAYLFIVDPEAVAGGERVAAAASAAASGASGGAQAGRHPAPSAGLGLGCGGGHGRSPQQHSCVTLGGKIMFI
jgi:hypothetical protein